MSIFDGTSRVVHGLIIEGKEGIGVSGGWSYPQLACYYAKMIEPRMKEQIVRNSTVPAFGLELVGNVFR